MKRNLLAFVLVCGFAVSAQAREVNIVNWKASTAYSWDDPALWDGGVVPTNAEDVVCLTNASHTLTDRLIVQMPPWSWTFDSISASSYNTYLRLPTLGQAPWNRRYRIGVRQLKDYNSLWPINFQYMNDNWKGCQPDSGFDFLGTQEDPTVVHRFYVGTLPVFGVPTVNNKAVIERLMHGGMFTKDGDGELVVKDVVGHETGVFLNGGTLTLDSPDCGNPAVAAGAFYHFRSEDAQVAVDVQDGRSYVTNWPSATDNGLKATPDESEYIAGLGKPGAPWVSSKTINGRRLLDFGKYRLFKNGQDPDWPSGQLKISTNPKNVCEIFMAAELEFGGDSSACPIVGDSGTSYYRMACLTNKVFEADVVNYGKMEINGEPAVASDGRSDPAQMRVISASIPFEYSHGNDFLGRFGSAGSGGRGGFRLGEIIVYTNQLTEVQRRATTNYLKKRWLEQETHATEREEWNLGDVVAQKEGASLNVKSGDMVRVRTLQSAGASVEKTGAGTLAVERIRTKGATVRVSGGKLKLLNELGPARTTKIADNPVLRFDASDETAFTYKEGTESNEIVAWRDSARGVLATNHYNATSGSVVNPPVRLIGASPTGLPVVDFPSAGVGWSYPLAPRMKFAGVNTVEGFIVWKSDLPAGTGTPPSVFSGGYGFVARARNQLLNYDTGARLMAWLSGALWTVNGLTCDPLDPTAFGDLGGETEWVVVHYAAGTDVLLDMLADSNSGGYGGACRIAELVAYDRPLTDRERRDTEAYLMKRWLGKAHPDNEAWQGRLSFAPGATAEIETDQDIAPVELVTESSAFGKSGAGKMSVGRMPTNVTDITVGGGGLSASLFASDTLYQMTLDAAWHFDASDPTSFEMEKDAAGDLRISTWYDVRKNGKSASANLVNCRVKPTYSVATEAGLVEGLPYVDFGPYSPCPKADGYVATNEQSAAMNLSEADASVMELHIVWSDRFTNNRAVFPLGRYADQGGLVRDNSKILQQSYNNMRMDTRLDGEVVDCGTKVKPDGFGVVSLVVTGCVTTAFTAANVDTIACDRRLNAGGVKIAEIIIYDTVQTDEKRAAIDAELLAKWRGIGKRTMLAGPAVSVASGATASFTEADNVVFSSVSGAGTFEADVLNIPEDFAHTVAFDAAGGCTQLKTGGNLTLPESATLTLSFPDGFKPETDRAYRIIDAAALVGAENIANWSVVNPLGTKREARLSVDAANGDVLLQFFAPGMMLIVR